MWSADMPLTDVRGALCCPLGRLSLSRDVREVSGLLSMMDAGTAVFCSESAASE